MSWLRALALTGHVVDAHSTIRTFHRAIEALGSK